MSNNLAYPKSTTGTSCDSSSLQNNGYCDPNVFPPAVNVQMTCGTNVYTYFQTCNGFGSVTGTLYNQVTAQSACSQLGNNWRLPSQSEFSALDKWVGGDGSYTQDPSTSYAFSTLRNNQNVKFWFDTFAHDEHAGLATSGPKNGTYPTTNAPIVRDCGEYGLWWTSTSGKAIRIDPGSLPSCGFALNFGTYNTTTTDGLSVRCIHD
jgi:uncharacterized protein (TIGR02145 family)